jgi:DNA-binding XRE family transcriptional regulator
MCRNRHTVTRRQRSIPPIVFNSVLKLQSIHDAPIRNRGSAASCSENPLHISTIRETLVCPVCKLRRFERGDTVCPRCHRKLGIGYIEIYLPGSLAPLSSQKVVAIRKKVGVLIRRLRSRREMTQAALASLTGIHRTYLSRAERGQVMPSVIALMQIARALEVDKVMLRVHSSSN